MCAIIWNLGVVPKLEKGNFTCQYSTLPHYMCVLRYIDPLENYIGNNNPMVACSET